MLKWSTKVTFIVLCFSLLPDTHSMIQWQTEPSPRVVIKGDLVMMSCVLQTSVASVVTWYKDGIQLDDENTEHLKIENFQQTEQGTYHCTHDIPAKGRVRSRMAHVTLLESHDLLELPVHLHSPTILPCFKNQQNGVLNGKGLPEGYCVRWKKGGKVVGNSKMNYDQYPGVLRACGNGGKENDDGDKKKYDKRESEEGELLSYNSTRQGSHVKTEVRHVKMQHVNGDLEVGVVEEGDLGTYVCEVISSTIKHDVRFVKLIKSEKKKGHMIHKAEDVSVVEGGVGVVLCAVNQGVHVQWSKKGTHGRQPSMIGGCSMYLVGVMEGGLYTLTSTFNNISISTVVYVRVVVKSQFISDPPTTLTAHINDDVIMDCDVTNNEKITWLKEGRDVEAGMMLDTSEEGRLSVEGVVLSDAGVYQCVVGAQLLNRVFYLAVQAKDSIEEETPPVFLSESGDYDESRAPGKPLDLRLLPSTHSINVTWARPANHKIRLRGYILGYGLGIPDENSQEIPYDVTSYVIEGLKSSSEYVVSLAAYNHVDQGSSVYESVFTTPPHELETTSLLTPPYDLRAVVTSNHQVQLRWTDQSYTRLHKFTGTTEGRHYIVRYNQRDLKRYKFINSSTPVTTISHLKPDTDYHFSVKVVSVPNKHSFWSVPTTARTLEAAPSSSPEDVSISLEHNNILLSWKPPRKPNGVITDYQVNYSEDMEDWSSEKVEGSLRQVVIEGLSPGSVYFFKVQAINKAGPGPVSPVVIFKTPEHKTTKMTAVVSDGVNNDPTWMMVALLLVVLVGVSSVVVVVLLCRKRKKKDSEKKSMSISPDPSSEKSSLKPPDLCSHARHLGCLDNESHDNNFYTNDITFAGNDNQDCSSLVDRWTLSTSRNESKFKMSTLLKNENDMPPTSPTLSNTHKSARVYVNDSNQGGPDIPPLMAPLTSPPIIFPSLSPPIHQNLFQKRESTENLSSEMQRIEHLMKDLQALQHSSYHS